MKKEDWFELAGISALAGGSVMAAILLIVLYGAALGGFVGAAVWVFRWITGI